MRLPVRNWRKMQWTAVEQPSMDCISSMVVFYKTIYCFFSAYPPLYITEIELELSPTFIADGRVWSMGGHPAEETVWAIGI